VTLFFLLLLSCIILFSTQKVGIRLSKFFPSVDCPALKKDLSADPSVREGMLETQAKLEWFYYMTMDKLHLQIDEISTSNLHCYCDDLMDDLGYWKAIKVEYTQEVEGGERFDPVSGYLCRDYL